MGQAGTYEQADQDGQLARYKITLQGLKRTANGASVTFLSANISQSSGGMPLNKEYALAPDGTRMDDIAVASEGAITDPGPGQKKAVTVEYALPTGFAGRIVFVAYDGMKEYDAFSVAVPTR